jgi:hypothetical protein
MNPFNVVAAIVAVSVAGITYKAIQTSAVVTERARVEQKAKKIDAKAQSARKSAASDPGGVLSGYCRDCGKSGSVSIVAPGDGVKK